MRKQNKVEAIIESQRRLLGITSQELAYRTVGSTSTWNIRLKDPLLFKQSEILRVFKCLNFDSELKKKFYFALENL